MGKLMGYDMNARAAHAENPGQACPLDPRRHRRVREPVPLDPRPVAQKDRSPFPTLVYTLSWGATKRRPPINSTR